MNDDWRVKVTCQNSPAAAKLGEQLGGGEFEHDMQGAAGERVIVSVDGPELFLYAGTREQAERATAAVQALATRSGASVDTELRRWHPAADEWVDPDVPLPAGADAVAAEHAELIAEERQESESLHASEYEVRVSTHSHRDTVELARTLGADGIPCLRRWRYLLIGAADEDAAKALANRIRMIAPEGSTIEVEATLAEVAAETPANPFSVFGGLGG
ncbi:MAG: hypothetical protein FWD04_03630 [Conexibacteraceae bacterium]|nr:hypothetical protein [Conexibacteraceae bacterium]